MLHWSYHGGGAHTLDAAELEQQIVDELAERQAEDITAVDISKVAGFADRFVIGTVTSVRQMNAVIDALDERLRREGVRLRRREGASESGWVLLDYGDVIVHLFGPEERAFYNLEGYWGRIAPVVRFQA